VGSRGVDFSASKKPFDCRYFKNGKSQRYMSELGLNVSLMRAF